MIVEIAFNYRNELDCRKVSEHNCGDFEWNFSRWGLGRTIFSRKSCCRAMVALGYNNCPCYSNSVLLRPKLGCDGSGRWRYGDDDLGTFRDSGGRKKCILREKIASSSQAGQPPFMCYYFWECLRQLCRGHLNERNRRWSDCLGCFNGRHCNLRWDCSPSHNAQEWSQSRRVVITCLVYHGPPDLTDLVSNRSHSRQNFRLGGWQRHD